MLKTNVTNIKNSLALELWKIRNPGIKYSEEIKVEKYSKRLIYSQKPSLKSSFHGTLPEHDIFTELTTARNKELISTTEQQKLQSAVVGFWGLSVGSHAALTWMMESRADLIKIVDPDTIDATNLNRLRFGWETLGQYKINAVKHQLLQINPYAKVISSTKTNSHITTKLVNENPPVDIIIDSIDDMSGKILLRSLCKQQKIPLISAADVGDNVVIDIERYDIDSNLQFFLGRLPGIEKVNMKKLSPRDKSKLIAQLVTFEQCSERMIDSMLSIGKTITTWPQLGATASIAGGVVATTIKKILLNEKVVSGRYVISLDNILVSDFNSLDRIAIRNGKKTIAENLFK